MTFRPNMRSQLVDEILFLKSNLDLSKGFETPIDSNEHETITLDDYAEIDYDVEEILVDIECGN